MELRHLRYFVAVAEELHFGRAAARLRISQPPLSRQIRDLEHELGTQLFLRTNRSVVLTEAGARFLKDVRVILSGVRQAAEGVRHLTREEAGRLDIGFVPVAGLRALPAAVRAFRALHPRIELRIQEMASGSLDRAIRERRVHAGFLTLPHENGTISLVRVLDEPLLAALPADHPLARKRQIPLDSLREFPHVYLPREPGPAYHDQVLGRLRAAGVRLSTETEGLHAALSIVATGDGASLVPASASCICREGIAYVPLADPLPAQGIALATRKEKHSPVLRSFVEAAVQALAAS